MTTDREALREKVARAIYEADDPWHTVWPWPDLKDGGADKIREIADAALSALDDQPAQEPVAWMVTGRVEQGLTFDREAADNMAQANGGEVVPLYAAPQPVTEDPLREIVFRYIDRANDVAPECGDPAERIVSEFARDVNAVLRSERPQPATLPDESR